MDECSYCHEMAGCKDSCGFFWLLVVMFFISMKCVCAAGYELDAAGQVCAACDDDSRKAVAGNSLCEECFVGADCCLGRTCGPVCHHSALWLAMAESRASLYPERPIGDVDGQK